MDKQLYMLADRQIGPIRNENMLIYSKYLLSPFSRVELTITQMPDDTSCRSF